MSRRDDQHFDDDETRMLRNFFRDEAYDYLERLTTALLATRGRPLPADTVTEMLRTTHTLKGSAATVGMAVVSELAHALEDCFDQIRGGRLAWVPALAEGLVSLVDQMRPIVDADDDAEAGALATPWRARLDELRRRPDQAQTERARRPTPPQHHRARERRATGGSGDRRRDERQVLRVDPQRVDRLMNSVGELVFDRTRIERRMQELRTLVRSMNKTRQRLRDVVPPDDPAHDAVLAIEEEMAQHIARLARSSAALVDDAEALRRTTQALQDGLTQVRMTSVRSLFGRLAGPLRELARAEGKQIDLITTGDDVEFDKAVADAIADPLLQLLRNAVAHGIEDPDARREAGKPETGTIRLGARHEGETVWIDVADDGAGIDLPGLRRRYVDRGLWSETQAATASENQVLRAMFHPGMSTRDEADELAGRGVGLDAVRETVASLGGDIEVESEAGVGATFALRLPLTTAISQALLFKIAGNVYAVPNVHVLETAHIEASSPHMPSYLRRSTEAVPLVVLHTVLGEPVPRDARRVPAVVIEYAGKRFAITCDRVIGPREIVIKSLGPLLSPLPLYAGATISGSGKVQLILDAAHLAQLAYPGVEQAEPRARRKRESSLPPLSGGAGRVLIADDSRAVRETLDRMLSGAGFIVDVAENGARALEMLSVVAYDALVTDIEMPQLDGFGLLAAMRANPRLAALPAIVISSRTARANRDRAANLGAHHFIPKPVTRRKLLTALHELLSPP